MQKAESLITHSKINPSINKNSKGKIKNQKINLSFTKSKINPSIST